MDLSYFKSSCQIRLIIDQLTVKWNRISRNIKRDACKKKTLIFKKYCTQIVDRCLLCPEEKAINKGIELTFDLKRKYALNVKRCSFLPYFFRFTYFKVNHPRQIQTTWYVHFDKKIHDLQYYQSYKGPSIKSVKARS